jgi:hypothetical protein
MRDIKLFVMKHLREPAGPTLNHGAENSRRAEISRVYAALYL